MPKCLSERCCASVVTKYVIELELECNWMLSLYRTSKTCNVLWWKCNELPKEHQSGVARGNYIEYNRRIIRCKNCKMQGSILPWVSSEHSCHVWSGINSLSTSWTPPASVVTVLTHWVILPQQVPERLDPYSSSVTAPVLMARRSQQRDLARLPQGISE